MEAIQRARRLTRWMLNSLLVIVWVMVATMTAVQFRQGWPWWALAPAVIATALFSGLYVRISRGIVEHRYATREVVVAGALALLATALGGADPVSWGFVPVAWMSVAVVGVERWRAVALGVGTFLVVTAAGVLAFLVGSPAFVLGPTTLSTLLFSVAVSGVWCLTMPSANRLWAWIWSLANEAHEGREAHTRLALAEERLRFARDLHDLVGHQLSAIAVKTDLAVRLAPEGPAKAEMTEVNALTRRALRELRQAVRGYRELDLNAELDSVRSVLEAAGVRCELHLPYRDPPAGVGPVFAYAVREAATNVLKHATATSCDITLRFTAQEAELLVRNDGVSRRQPADLGTGLAGMQERLAVLGGKLTARPTDEGEFILKAVVSLPIRGVERE